MLNNIAKHFQLFFLVKENNRKKLTKQKAVSYFMFCYFCPRSVFFFSLLLYIHHKFRVNFIIF